MKKKLFLSELKRALFPTFVTVFAVYILLLFVQRFVLYAGSKSMDDEKNIRSAISLFLGIWLVASGFLSGVRPFSVEFKARHSLLLQTLPLGRSWIWLLLVSASLLVSLSCLAVILMLRSDMFMNAPLVLLGLFLYLLLFAAGCCFSLLHERLYLVYIIGGFITAMMVGVLFVLYVEYYAGSDSLADFMAMEQQRLATGVRFISGSLTALSILYMGLSWFSFTSGEFLLWRTQLRNYLLLIFSSCLFLVMLNFGVPVVLKATGNWESDRVMVSPDGKYIAVYETLSEYSPFFRITVTDVATGARAGTLEFQSFRLWRQSQCEWSQNENVLNLVISQASAIRAILFPSSDSLQRLSPDCRELEKRTFPSGIVVRMKPLPAGDLFAIISFDDLAKLVRISPETGITTELTTTGAGFPDFRWFDQGLLVTFQSDKRSKAWLYNSSWKEVRYVPDANGVYAGAYFMSDTVYDSPSVFEKEMVRDYPPPGNAGGSGPGGYFLPRPLTKIPPVFYFQADQESKSGALFVCRRPGSLWKQIGSGIPLEGRETVTPDQEDLVSLGAVHIDYLHHTAAFITEQTGMKQLNVYDMTQNSIVSVASTPARPETFVHVWKVQGLNGVLIESSHRTSNDEWRADRTFRYITGTDRLEEMNLHVQVSSLLYRDEKGNEIISEITQKANADHWETFKISRVSSNDEKWQLWPPQ